jgi:hypothetical protein
VTTALRDLIANPNAAELELIARYGMLPEDARRERAFEAFAKGGLPHRRVEGWHWTDFKAALPVIESPSDPGTSGRPAADRRRAGVQLHAHRVHLAGRVAGRHTRSGQTGSAGLRSLGRHAAGRPRCGAGGRQDQAGHADDRGHRAGPAAASLPILRRWRSELRPGPDHPAPGRETGDQRILSRRRRLYGVADGVFAAGWRGVFAHGLPAGRQGRSSGRDGCCPAGRGR